MEAANKARRLTNEERELNLAEQFLDDIDYLRAKMRSKLVEYRGQHATPVTYDCPPPSELKNLAVSVAVIFDKYLALVGKANSRMEIMNKYEQLEAMSTPELMKFADEQYRDLKLVAGGKENN